MKQTAEAIIRKFKLRGINVYMVGKDPYARAKWGKVSSDVVAELKANRDEIVKVLDRRKKNPPCYACGSETWWNSKHTEKICIDCHPPAKPKLVVNMTGICS